ncbi:MAG: ABC transporter permease subunit [Kiritimatiellia bacterium]
MSWLSPATREKFQRFRKLRRAWFSFCLLSSLFVLSLFSELIANDTPWLLRFEGAFYWPRLQQLSQDLFLKDGVQTSPDYHLLSRSEAFAAGSGNWMAWAPVRFKPSNTLSPDRIELPEEVTVIRNRAQRVSDLRVNARGAMKPGRGAEWFFPQGLQELPEPLLKALQPRFDNQPAPEWSFPDPGGRFVWYLSPYEVLERSPRSQRILLREILPADLRPESFTIPKDATVRPDWWPEDPLAEERLQSAHSIPVEPLQVTDAEGAAWEIRFVRETVQFPFRPVKNHPLGLDQSGRDVRVLILYATRISLLFGFILVFCSMFLGTLLGGLQGYFGGRLDLFTQRIIEIYGAIPFLYAMIYLGSVFGRSFGLLLFVYAIFNWIGISYYMRAEFLKLRKQPFIEAAHSLGLPTGRIMWKHILPNALVPLITFFPFSLVGAIGSLSALDYIGFGLPVGTPSWGDLLSQAQTYRYAWWLIVYPALTLFVVILLGVFIGEGLRNAFDPKRETHWEA